MDLDGVLLGVGLIVAFGDENANGILDEGEIVVGGSPIHAVTYLRGDIRAFATWHENSDIKKLYTMLTIPQGYSLTKAVSPDEHGFPVPFDDLVPIDPKPVSIIVPRNKDQIRFPNWT